MRALLAAQPDFNVVGEAGTWEEALEQLRSHPVDVVILDVTVPVPAPGRDGIDLIAQVNALQPRARTLVLTAHTENEYAARALRAGAKGYVTKDDTPEMLMGAVRRVTDGAVYLTPNVAESLALRAVLQEGVPAAHESLSPRERLIFGLLADGKTVSEIAQCLALSVKTISAHKLNVLRKLQMRNVAQLVRYAIEHRVSSP